MPGFVDDRYKCRECWGRDVGMVGLIIHKPTCSQSPGYLEARMREAVARAERRAKRDEWLKSPEAARLRALRTVS